MAGKTTLQGSAVEFSDSWGCADRVQDTIRFSFEADRVMVSIREAGSTEWASYPLDYDQWLVVLAVARGGPEATG